MADTDIITINGVEYPYVRGWGHYWQLITPVGQYRVASCYFVTENKTIYHMTHEDDDGTEVAGAMHLTQKSMRDWFIEEVGKHIAEQQERNNDK